MMGAWEQDEFVLDPCRITLYIGPTGIDGDTFKRTHLMDRFGVQINKTSRNTVLFMTHIGTTRSSVAYLIEILVQIVRELEDRVKDMGPLERTAHDTTVWPLTNASAPLPDFSAFHDGFRSGDSQTPEGNMRRAFFLAYNDRLCEYLMPDEVIKRIDAGDEIVSASFVTRYPPGFPVLVPGQIFSRDILSYMSSLDTPEIHGLRAHLGYRVFTEQALRQVAGVPSAIYNLTEPRTPPTAGNPTMVRLGGAATAEGERLGPPEGT
jgi:arginine/lysine/ornithine decarboxylase